MAITPRVREQMFQPVTAAAGETASTARSRTPIRIPITRQQIVMPIDPSGSFPRASAFGATWTPAEHERFLQGLEVFPSGPWKAIADFIGTKTARQAMTHAQKYRQKIERRRRALEHQAQERQSAENAAGGAATKPPISAVAVAPATVILTPVSNSGDLLLEHGSEPITVGTLEESILELFYNGELNVGDGSEGHSDGDDDLNRQLIQQLMRDADNLADQQLLHESVMLFGGEAEAASVPFSLQPWSLDEPLFAFGVSDIGSLLSDDSGSALEFALEFAFVPDELTRVNHEDIQIWFGESKSERESEYQ